MMKQKLWACVLIILMLSGCVQSQAPSTTSDVSVDSDSEIVSSSIQTESEDSMIENSESVAEGGVNGMTEEEILELFVRKVNEANDFYFWLRYDCYEDINVDLERIYDTDDTNPEGFYWLPLVRFETRNALYEYMGTVFRPMGVPGELDWMFGEEIWGVEGDGGKAVYISIFKEIDGLLYVRDRGYPKGERRQYFSHNFETSTVAEESEGEIKIDVDVHSYSNGPRDRFRLLLEDSHWVISWPTHL